MYDTRKEVSNWILRFLPATIIAGGVFLLLTTWPIFLLGAVVALLLTCSLKSN